MTHTEEVASLHSEIMRLKLEAEEAKNKQYVGKGEKTMFQCSICGLSKQCGCGACLTCSVPHDGRIHELLSRAERAESRLSSAERVVQTVRGFRDHGEAKNGTHAGIMFAALTHHDQEAAEGKI